MVRQTKKTHKLMVIFSDNPTQWREVESVNLGSAKKPNEEILKVRFQALDDNGENRSLSFTFFKDE